MEEQAEGVIGEAQPRTHVNEWPGHGRRSGCSCAGLQHDALFHLNAQNAWRDSLELARASENEQEYQKNLFTNRCIQRQP